MARHVNVGADHRLVEAGKTGSVVTAALDDAFDTGAIAGWGCARLMFQVLSLEMYRTKQSGAYI